MQKKPQIILRSGGRGGKSNLIFELLSYVPVKKEQSCKPLHCEGITPYSQ